MAWLKKQSLNILRISLGITFFWIGLMILKAPETWGGYLKPWAVKLLPISVKELMITTGIFDMFLGILLILNILPWLSSLLASLHLLSVLIVSGITDITVRNIGLLGAGLFLFFNSLPANIYDTIYQLRGRNLNNSINNENK